MPVIRPSVTVNATTDSGDPSGRHATTPGKPPTSTRGLRPPRRSGRPRPRSSRRGPRPLRPACRRSGGRPGRARAAAPRSRRRGPPSGTRGPPPAADRPAAGGRAVARTFRRARLASILVAAVDLPRIWPISSNGTANRSCSTNASRSLGPSDSRTTSSASPTESASATSSSGRGCRRPSPRRDLVVGASGRAWRERRTSRLIRPTTVVSQPSRLPMVAASWRDSRSQASWTTSSASACEPSTRWATARSRSRCASNASVTGRRAVVVTFLGSAPSW